MQRGRVFFITVALMLAAAGAWGQATNFKDVANLDFSKVDPNNPGVTINGYGGITSTGFSGSTAPVPSKQVLRMTDGGGQATSFFLPTPIGLSDYQVQFDFQVQPPTAGATGDAIADGFTFTAQSNSDSAIGNNGGSVGWQGAAISQFGYTYAVDFNTYPQSGIPAVNNSAAVPEIVSLDLGFPFSRGGRTQLFPVALPMVGQGTIHSVIRVTPDKITATFTGGKIPASTPIVFSAGLTGIFKPLGTDGKPLPLYFGMTAGTGGSSMVLDIFNFRLQVPA